MIWNQFIVELDILRTRLRSERDKNAEVSPSDELLGPIRTLIELLEPVVGPSTFVAPEAIAEPVAVNREVTRTGGKQYTGEGRMIRQPRPTPFKVQPPDVQIVSEQEARAVAVETNDPLFSIAPEEGD